MNARIARSIDAIIDHALQNSLIHAGDIILIKNQIYEALGLPGPDRLENGAVAAAAEQPMTIDALLGILSDHAVSAGIIEDSPMCREALETKIMGLCTPLPSHIERQFFAMEQADPEAALDWFYRMNVATNYIRIGALARNIAYRAVTSVGELQITINLSKPEKDPRDIAAELAASSSGYPACLLCRENVGYAGRAGWPARHNLRVLPVALDGESWYLQYSPYQYYHQHCIVLSHEHRPMGITDRVFSRLLSFVKRFPAYFLGSNAGLPVVGGSILSHDHYQGGKHAFPMDRAAALGQCHWRGVRVTALDWPLPALRLEGGYEAVREAAVAIQSSWLVWRDEACGIVPYTGSVQHNAITPIARAVGGGYRLDLVLRNNRTDEAHPLGIFHPYADKHHIKKENIGLIEVMGCMILPGRLKEEVDHAALALTDSAYRHPALERHEAWLDQLRAAHGTLAREDAQKLLYQEVGEVCAGVLRDAGVYKQTPEGREGLGRWMGSMGIEM